jgi:cysteinyl-tRNA synthetase
MGDLVRRSLLYLGYDVHFVRNVTDVGHLTSNDDFGEDKMAKGAKQEGTTPAGIAKKYTDLYHRDVNLINVLVPTDETTATDYIKQMAKMVQDLIDNGYAYGTSKAIYFDVDKFENYTELNKQDLSKMREGAGHGEVSDSEKKKPYDFAVWFFKTGQHENALQSWNVEFSGIEQPTKKGFPGWHIECSAMAKDRLGKTIDIHMGGIEHIPVHHTNEIAQSEAANKQKFANYWLHHELIMIDDGKMSKSKGNVYTMDDIVDRKIDSLAFRYFAMQSHYRSKQNFTWEALKASEKALDRLRNFVREWSTQVKGEDTPDKSFQKKFKDTLEDDFNIPMALAVVWDLVKSDLEVSRKLATILDFDKVLGLNLEHEINDPDHFDFSDEVSQLLEKRQSARESKDWEMADEIRDELHSRFGVVVKDTERGQVAKKV